MNLDVGSLATIMIEAVRKTIGNRWPAIRAIVELELRRLAQSLEDVQRLLAEGVIDRQRAMHHVEMHRNTAVSIVKTVEGIGLATAREVVDTAANAAGAVVNRLVGFKLIATKGD